MCIIIALKIVKSHFSNISFYSLHQNAYLNMSEGNTIRIEFTFFSFGFCKLDIKMRILCETANGQTFLTSLIS